MDKHIYTDKEVKKILRSDVQLSETVEQSLSDAYTQILEKGKTTGVIVTKSQRWSWKKTVMIAAAVCLLPVTAFAAYVSQNSDFYQSFFGNTSRESVNVREVPDDKGGTFTAPSTEYVPVDEEKAEALLGEYMSNDPVTFTVEDYTFTVESCLIDEVTRSGRIYYTVENPNGIANIAITDDGEEAYYCNDIFIVTKTASDEFFSDHDMVDKAKSSDTKMYLCKTFGNPGVTNLDSLVFNVLQYGKDDTVLRDEDIVLPHAESIKGTQIRNSETEDLQVSFSAIAILINMGELGLEEYVQVKEDGSPFIDPYYVRYVALEFEDGSTYVVQDEDNNIMNCNIGTCNNMQLGIGFNRLVDYEKVAKVLINDLEFPVQSK